MHRHSSTGEAFEGTGKSFWDACSGDRIVPVILIRPFYTLTGRQRRQPRRLEQEREPEASSNRASLLQGSINAKARLRVELRWISRNLARYFKFRKGIWCGALLLRLSEPWLSSRFGES